MPSKASSQRKSSSRWAPQVRYSLRRARRIRFMIQIVILIIILLILFPAWIIYKPPRWLVSSIANKYPSVIFHVETDEKVVALTIDDTPSRYTRDILSILSSNNATATFFVIGGQVHGEEEEALLADIVRQGSELGNHAMHDEPSISLTTDVLESEIAQVDWLINRAYQQAGRVRQMTLFRPGSGFFGERLMNVCNDAGYTVTLGDIFPHDPYISSWRINAWHILSSLRPGGIIIVHDRRSWTPPLLRKIVPTMQQKGYFVVGLSEAFRLTESEPE